MFTVFAEMTALLLFDGSSAIGLRNVSLKHREICFLFLPAHPFWLDDGFDIVHAYVLCVDTCICTYSNVISKKAKQFIFCFHRAL